ncbi:hypothetical protein [Neobacillus endophyticus]|nr:hypothetical protein [Neobacillus endophyticus]
MNIETPKGFKMKISSKVIVTFFRFLFGTAGSTLLYYLHSFIH